MQACSSDWNRELLDVGFLMEYTSAAVVAQGLHNEAVKEKEGSEYMKISSGNWQVWEGDGRPDNTNFKQ